MSAHSVELETLLQVSCATALSWAAKPRLGHGLRRLLGGHAKLGDLSMLEYSRDALAEPLEGVGAAPQQCGLHVQDRFRGGHPDRLRDPQRVACRIGALLGDGRQRALGAPLGLVVVPPRGSRGHHVPANT